MDSLPVELVELICDTGALQMEDALNLSLTCKHLKDVVENSNYIWRVQFLRKWPQYELLTDNTDIDYLKEVKYIYETRRIVRDILDTMSPRFYCVPDMSASDFKEWLDLIGTHPRTYEYVVDYLVDIINDRSPISSIESVPMNTPGNITLNYYCLKVIQFLRHKRIAIEFEEYMKMPEARRTLEKGAVLIAQWCQPEVHVFYSNIRYELDILCQQARDELELVNPKHPLFSISQEKLEEWKDCNLMENQFSFAMNVQIIDSLKLVLFRKNRFTGNIGDFYRPQNSYINIVLAKRIGLPITLSIVFESLARRMGLNCEPMNIPAHFLLRVQPDSTNPTILFIDAFNEGQIFPRGVCPYSLASATKMPRATAYKVLKRMASNLEESLRVNTHSYMDINQVRSVLELLVMICPHDLNTVLNLSRLCMSLNMDIANLEDILLSTEYEEPQNAENVLQMLRDYDIHRQHEHFFEQFQPKRRLPEMKFAVGMIIRHKLLNYKAVITAWTTVCKATHAWQKSMNVDKLKDKANQPFYNVIVEDDGTPRYVAEENIELSVDNISYKYSKLNEELGRHFSHFFINHYVPNPEKEREYPEDTNVRKTYYQNSVWNSKVKVDL